MAAGALQQQRQQQQVQQTSSGASGWSWHDVQQFAVIGLGSIGRLLAPTSAARTGPSLSAVSQAPPPARLAYRLQQLVVATALATSTGLIHASGPGARPLATDPDFDAFDVELLNSLGFRAHSGPADPLALLPQGGGPRSRTLLYMPCCPRELYTDMLVRWAEVSCPIAAAAHSIGSRGKGCDC